MSTEVLASVEVLLKANDLEIESRVLRELKDLLTDRENTSYFFSNQDLLNGFMNYLFSRRFGWADISADNPIQTPKKILNRSVSFELGAKLKKTLISITDQFLEFLREQPIAASLLDALIDCAAKFANKPVARKQTFEHFFDWMRLQIADNANYDRNLGLIDSNFQLVKHLVVTGITDVWSAIRKTCMTGLEWVSTEFTARQLEALLGDFTTIAFDPSATWQVKEGSVLGILAIINTFKLEPVYDIFEDSKDLHSTSFILKHGGMNLNSLPPFLRGIRPVLYQLLAHAQLSIREYAISAFNAFLQRSKPQETVESFPEVVSRLLINVMPGTETLSHNEEFDTSRLVSNSTDPWLADAYESEALLGVCSILVKNSANNSFFSLPNWKLYLATFLLYLSHPASTVRQSSSMIFKDLVTKNQHSNVFKLLLQSLTMDLSYPETEPKEKFFTELPSLKPFKFLNLPIFRRTSWEWLEGRFFAHEFVLRHLLSNHTNYIFPFIRRTGNIVTPPAFNPPTEETDRFLTGSPSSEKPKLDGSPSPRSLRRSSSEDFTSNSRKRQSSQNRAPSSPKPQGSVSLINQFITNTSKPFPLYEFDMTPIELPKALGVLKHILFQVTNCFGSETRWELVRMADQLLPLLAEVILYIDVDTLHSYWVTYIKHSLAEEPSCFSACKSLRAVFKKLVSFEESFMKYPDSYWSSLTDKDRISQILNKVKSTIPPLTHEIVKMASQRTNLKLMSTNVELLLMIHTFWYSTIPTTTRREHIALLLSVFSEMNEKQEESNSTGLRDSLKEKIAPKLTKKAQFMRNLLSSIYMILPKFVVTCDIDQMLSLVPDLVDLVISQDDPEAQLALLESVLRIIHCAEKTSTKIVSELETACNLCVSKLMLLMGAKTLETVIIRKMSDIFSHICLIWCDLRYLPAICHYAATSLNQETISKVMSTVKENSNSLQIMSNHIQKSIQDEVVQEEEDELNSSKSGSLISEESSDWDNWDDEEAGDGDISSNIKEVVRLLEVLQDAFSDADVAKKQKESAEHTKMLGTGQTHIQLTSKRLHVDKFRK